MISIILCCGSSFAANGDPCPAYYHAKKGRMSGARCAITECESGWLLQSKGSVYECVKQCKKDYVPKGKECVKSTKQEDKKEGSVCVCEDQAKKHATVCTIKNGSCKIKDCLAGYELNGEECKEKDKKEGSICVCEDQGKKHATVCTIQNGSCEIKDCLAGYELTTEGCVKSCVTQAKKIDKNVKAAVVNGKECKITECKKGFKVEGDKCIADEQNNDSDNAEAVAQPKVSEEEMAELEKNYQDAKAKEQSIGNRLLTTASIATIGAGAQVALTGISEKKADEDAEADMSSYLSSFRCSYTGSKSYKNGEKNIELPGANQLMSLFQEYKSLAADLKERKEALGMKAGIESEVILDKADGGLYDDVGVGITDKHYTSVANALMDSTSEDAKKWNEQKESASKKVKTGAIVAGVGVVGSIVGNELINKVFCKPEDQNAKSGKKEGDICKITKCKDGYELNEADNKCEKGKGSNQNEESCTPTDKHAKSGKKEGDVCKIIKCDTDFVPNEDNTKCENSAGDCSEEDLKKVDQHATAGQYFDKQGAKVCKITDCEDGYSVALNKCIEVNNYNAEEESVSGGSNTSGIAAIVSKFGGGTGKMVQVPER